MALPELWGPTAWRILHGASFDADAGSFARLVDVLQRVLPCPHCRTSFQYYCRDVPLACMDPALDPLAVAKWCWRLHDSVNRKLAKWPRLPFSSLQRRHAVFGLTVASDDAFGFLLVVLQQTPDAHDLAPALADCFPAAFYAPFLRARVPSGADGFEHFAGRKRAFCIATQQPIETVGQMRQRCEAVRVTHAPPPSTSPPPPSPALHEERPRSSPFSGVAARALRLPRQSHFLVRRE